MPATAAWLASVEALLNRGIDASARAAALARRLEGTALQVDIEGFTGIRASVVGGRLALTTGEDAGAAHAAAAHATRPFQDRRRRSWQLLKGGANRQARPAPAGRPAQIRGDAEIANLYRELFASGAA